MLKFNKQWFGLPALSLLFFLPFAAAVEDEGWFTVYHAETHLEQGVYKLSARLEYRLSSTALEAMHNGVPLTIVLSIKVLDDRWYVLKRKIAELQQRYRLSYHSLAGRYILVYLNTDLQESFAGVEGALRKISKLEDFPLLDAHVIDKQNTYSVQLKNYLDIEQLPAPLRPVAYFSGQWRLSGETYKCPLKP